MNLRTRTLLRMAACYGDDLDDVDPIARIIIEAESGRCLVLGDAEISSHAKEVATTPTPVPRKCSPIEKSILVFLKDGEWLHAQKIADGIGEEKTPALMVILGNLAAAGILESNTNRGYRMTPAKGTEVANEE